MEGKGKKYTLFGNNFFGITGRHSCILFTVRNLMIFNVNIFRVSEKLSEGHKQGPGIVKNRAIQR
jgi:hypothetical protein